jgi:ABC-type transport system involved in multi-copper enzyme maturation permease subunit
MMNPIVKKDMRVRVRSMRMCWGIFAYAAIMAMVFFFAIFFFKSLIAYDVANIYSYIIMLYPVLALTQIGILGVVIPINTASSISGEKERQTFDIMMTTSMTPFSIIAGKVISAMIDGMSYVVAGLPIMALAFVIGGISWSYLFKFIGVALLVSLFSASIGIMCSSLCKKSITAVTMSYGIYIIFFVVTAIPYETLQIMGIFSGMLKWLSVALLIINPVSYLKEFFVWIMGGGSPSYSGFDITNTRFGVLDTSTFHNIWMSASTFAFIVVSFLFLFVAEKRISRG